MGVSATKPGSWSGDSDGFGGLVLGAQPADEALGFFGAALGVEAYDALQDLLGGEVVGPAVCVEDGAVEVVVDFAQVEHSCRESSAFAFQFVWM